MVPTTAQSTALRAVQRGEVYRIADGTGHRFIQGRRQHGTIAATTLQILFDHDLIVRASADARGVVPKFAVRKNRREWIAVKLVLTDAGAELLKGTP